MPGVIILFKKTSATNTLRFECVKANVLMVRMDYNSESYEKVAVIFNTFNHEKKFLLHRNIVELGWVEVLKAIGRSCIRTEPS